MEGVEAVGDLLTASGHQLAVLIECHGCRCVAEHVLEHLHVGSGRYRERRAGVSQVVNAKTGEPGLAHSRLPDPVPEVVDLQRRAFGRSEHECAALAR